MMNPGFRVFAVGRLAIFDGKCIGSEWTQCSARLCLQLRFQIQALLDPNVQELGRVRSGHFVLHT